MDEFRAYEKEAKGKGEGVMEVKVGIHLKDSLVDRAEILFWKGKYEREEDQDDSGLEQRVSEKFRQNRYATKKELEEIIKWKFQGRLMGRQKLNLKRLESFDDQIIVKITALAFEIPFDKIKLKLLMTIDGVGPAVASVILTFHDPENYGVLDFHVWHGLFNSEKKSLDEKDCLIFFEELRKLSHHVGLPCRDVEKAIFKKDLNESSQR